MCICTYVGLINVFYSCCHSVVLLLLFIPVIVPLLRLDRASLRTAIILFPFLGLGWTLGLFIFGENLDYIQAIEWIFFVVVTLQGILIFVLNCLVNTEVRRPYTKPCVNIMYVFTCIVHVCMYFSQVLFCFQLTFHLYIHIPTTFTVKCANVGGESRTERHLSISA